MTAIESGTAIGVQYVEHEKRATAIHEAGHAAAAHIYRPDLESSRLSVRMRGRSLGHHQSFQREERFSEWQNEAMGNLVHILGAMAAERVFYKENTNGVGGDLQSATADAAWMVGTSGMGPQYIELNGAKFDDETRRADARADHEALREDRADADEPHARQRRLRRDPVASVLQDPYKRAAAAQILGQAYVTAENFIAANREAVERIAEAVIEKGELYGDELVGLLDRQQPEEARDRLDEGGDVAADLTSATLRGRCRTGAGHAVAVGAARRAPHSSASGSSTARSGRCSSLAIVGVVDLRDPLDQPGAEVVGVEAERRRPRRGKADRGPRREAYHLPNGDQLVDVISKAPSITPARRRSRSTTSRSRARRAPGTRSTRSTSTEQRHVLALRARRVLRDRDREAVGRARRARAPRDPRARALHLQVRRRRRAT